MSASILTTYYPVSCRWRTSQLKCHNACGNARYQIHRLDALDAALDALDLDLLVRRVRRSEELSVPVHVLARFTAI